MTAYRQPSNGTHAKSCSAVPDGRHGSGRKRSIELENKTIIITGTRSGIGEAAASVFAAEGAN